MGKGASLQACVADGSYVPEFVSDSSEFSESAAWSVSSGECENGLRAEVVSAVVKCRSVVVFEFSDFVAVGGYAGAAASDESSPSSGSCVRCECVV